MYSKLIESSSHHLKKLISVYDKLSGGTLSVPKNPIFQEFDEAFKYIVKSTESFYQKKNLYEEFKLNYEYFDKLIENAKRESSQNDLVKTFWEKEKNTSLQNVSEMMDFVDRAGELIEILYSKKFLYNNLLDTIRIVREFLSETIDSNDSIDPNNF